MGLTSVDAYSEVMHALNHEGVSSENRIKYALNELNRYRGHLTTEHQRGLLGNIRGCAQEGGFTELIADIDQRAADIA